MINGMTSMIQVQERVSAHDDEDNPADITDDEEAKSKKSRSHSRSQPDILRTIGTTSIMNMVKKAVASRNKAFSPRPNTQVNTQEPSSGNKSLTTEKSMRYQYLHQSK